MSESIAAYVVNLKNRIDRKEHILKEYSAKAGFDICFFDAITNKIPAVGLYESLKGVVELAKMRDLPYVLFCEDDHQFTDCFDFGRFIDILYVADNKEADLLLGGVSWFDYGVKLSTDLYWINSFTGMQFTIIFSRFFDKILTIPFNKEDVIAKWRNAVLTKAMDWNHLLDSEKKVRLLYNVSAIPVIILIDPNGHIVYIKEGGKIEFNKINNYLQKNNLKI